LLIPGLLWTTSHRCSCSKPYRWRKPNRDLRFSWRASLRKFHRKLNRHVLFSSRTKAIAQNIRSYIERLLLRAAQRVLGSRMRFSGPRWETLALRIDWWELQVLYSNGWLHTTAKSSRSYFHQMQYIKGQKLGQKFYDQGGWI